VNLLTLFLELVVVGWLLRRGGLAWSLLVLPVSIIVGFPVLVYAPSVTSVAVIQVIRRATEYAIARPAREVLFTVVSRDEKYKAKTFIDTVLARGGDALSGWTQTALRALGWGQSGIAAAATPVAILLGVIAVWLARRQETLRQVADVAAGDASSPVR
jgi:AAA family ATP:ADP antiporter